MDPIALEFLSLPQVPSVPPGAAGTAGLALGFFFSPPLSLTNQQSTDNIHLGFVRLSIRASSLPAAQAQSALPWVANWLSTSQPADQQLLLLLLSFPPPAAALSLSLCKHTHTHSLSLSLNVHTHTLSLLLHTHTHTLSLLLHTHTLSLSHLLTHTTIFHSLTCTHTHSLANFHHLALLITHPHVHSPTVNGIQIKLFETQGVIRELRSLWSYECMFITWWGHQINYKVVCIFFSMFNFEFCCISTCWNAWRKFQKWENCEILS